MQGRNGNTNIENGLVDPVGEGESEMNGESSINIYSLSGVRWISSVLSYCSIGSLVWCSVMTWRDRVGEGEGRERGREYMYNYG